MSANTFQCPTTEHCPFFYQRSKITRLEHRKKRSSARANAPVLPYRHEQYPLIDGAFPRRDIVGSGKALPKVEDKLDIVLGRAEDGCVIARP